jgi:putative ABC transport system permease protein
MIDAFVIAWRQLSFQKTKLLVATAGVVVAVMLMLVQLGIRRGALESSVSLATRFECELVVASRRNETIFEPTSFPRRLLYRLPSHPQVDRVQEVYMSRAKVRNPWTYVERPILIYGMDPREPLLRVPGLSNFTDQLNIADRVLFDSRSRSAFGPIAKTVMEDGALPLEVNYRAVKVIGSIPMGVSISIDGNLFVTPANFLRLTPSRDMGAIDLGLVKLLPGADPIRVCDELQSMLGKEAEVMLGETLLAREINFVRNSAPIDFIFGMGAIVGFFIGFVVVYQILYTEVTNHLPHYATMKAMGFTDRYLVKVVVSQAIILAVLGYLPGFSLAVGLYQVATMAIEMPFTMTASRAIAIFVATIAMCCLSALIAIRKVRTANPADVF